MAADTTESDGVSPRHAELPLQGWCIVTSPRVTAATRQTIRVLGGFVSETLIGLRERPSGAVSPPASTSLFGTRAVNAATAVQGDPSSASPSVVGRPSAASTVGSVGSCESAAHGTAKATGRDTPVLHCCVVRVGDCPAERSVLSEALWRRCRAERVPIFTEAWVDAVSTYQYAIPAVEASVCDREAAVATRRRRGSGTAAARGGRWVAYDPACLAGLVFTCSDLPSHVRGNVYDAVRFFGGMASNDLLNTTTHIVAPAACVSDKVAAGRRQGAHVVATEYVQAVIRDGLRPLDDPYHDRSVDVALSLFDALDDDSLHRPAAAGSSNKGSAKGAAGGAIQASTAPALVDPADELSPGCRTPRPQHTRPNIQVGPKTPSSALPHLRHSSDDSASSGSALEHVEELRLLDDGTIEHTPAQRPPRASRGSVLDSTATASRHTKRHRAEAASIASGRLSSVARAPSQRQGSTRGSPCGPLPSNARIVTRSVAAAIAKAAASIAARVKARRERPPPDSN